MQDVGRQNTIFLFDTRYITVDHPICKKHRIFLWYNLHEIIYMNVHIRRRPCDNRDGTFLPMKFIPFGLVFHLDNEKNGFQYSELYVFLYILQHTHVYVYFLINT